MSPTRFCFRERRRQQAGWDIHFALELSEMAASRPSQPARFAKAVERMVGFLRGAWLPDRDMGLEFRIVCNPKAAAPERPVRLAIRFRASHRQLKSARALAQGIVDGMIPSFSAACPEALWIPVSKRASYDALFRPFRKGQVAEVLQRVEDIQILPQDQALSEPHQGRNGRPLDDQPLRGSVQAISPFIPVADAWTRVIKILQSQGGRTLVSVALAPTRLAQHEKGVLREQLRLCELGLSFGVGGVMEGDGGGSEATGVMMQTLHSLRTLGDCAFVLKVQAAGVRGMSGPLINAIGAALFAPAGFPSSAMGAEGGLQYFRGGFSVRRPEGREEERVATGNLERIAFDPWPEARRGAGRLPGLIGPAEAAGLICLSQSDVGALPGFFAGASRRVPLPQAMAEEGLSLGFSNFNGRPHEVRLSQDTRRRHAYVLGATGTGKTSLLAKMCLQDIQAGRGIAVLDPHGSLVSQLLPQVPLARRSDLVHVDFGDPACGVALNLLEHEGVMERDLAINHVLEIFNLLYNMKECGGPVFELYMRTCLMLVMADPAEPGTLLDVLQIFTSKDFAAQKLAACREEHVREAWRMMREASGQLSLKDVAPYIVSKLNLFANNHLLRAIVSKPRSSIDFPAIMDGRKILLVDLAKGRIGKTYASFLGLILAGQIVRATLKRSLAAPDFHLYVDEFQNLATPSFAEMLAEARKFRVSAVLANQFLHQVPEEIRRSILANVGTIVSLRVGPQDAELLESTFSPAFDKQDLLTLPIGRGCVSTLSSGGCKLSPFTLDTPFSAPPAGPDSLGYGVEDERPVEPPAVGKGGGNPRGRCGNPKLRGHSNAAAGAEIVKGS